MMTTGEILGAGWLYAVFRVFLSFKATKFYLTPCQWCEVAGTSSGVYLDGKENQGPDRDSLADLKAKGVCEQKEPWCPLSVWEAEGASLLGQPSSLPF